MRDITLKMAHLWCNLLHWLGLSILLGHEEAPQVLIDNLGRQLNSIILICRASRLRLCKFFSVVFPLALRPFTLPA